MIFPHIRPIQWGNNFAFFLLMSLLLPRILLASSLSPVALHGNLQVQDGVLVDQSGKSIQLRGMSSFWLNWMGKFANPSSIAWLQNDWKINVFRAAVGIEEAGGYLEKPEATLQKVDEIITTCEKTRSLCNCGFPLSPR